MTDYVPELRGRVVALYCDGGVIQANPSPIGGTWAWCAVDASGERIAESSGVRPGAGTTNNLMELIAAVRGLEAMPEGWAGALYTDSNITRGRLFEKWLMRGIPEEWIIRAQMALDRLGVIKGVLLAGHPSKADLKTGKDHIKLLPVSIHNVWCDEAATEAGRQYLMEGKET